MYNDGDSYQPSYNPEFLRRVRERRRREKGANRICQIRNGDRPAVKSIIEAVEDMYGLEPGSIIGPSLDRTVVAARFKAIRMARDARPDMSIRVLGRVFGGRTRTTIRRALKKAEAA